MCVIIYKPAGVSLPSYNILKAAYNHNSDGCGFVSTKRSYKSLDFEKFLDNLELVNDEEECIIHFRWATHGSVKRANCHPFCKNSVFFAHNGILSIEPYKDMTDSETAFRAHIYPIIHRFGYDSKQVDEAVSEIIGGSRFALMHKGKVKLYGSFKKLGGCYYSNLRFLPLNYNFHNYQFVKKIV